MKKFLFALCIVMSCAAEHPQLSPEDSATAEKGLYWLIAGGFCFYKAAGQLMCHLSSDTEYEVLGMRKLSPEFKERVERLVNDLGITEQLEFRRFNKKSECGSPAAASSRCLYFEEKACAACSDQELRAIIAHEYAHLKERHNTVSLVTFLALPFLAQALISGYLTVSAKLIESIPDTKYRWIVHFVHKPFEWLLSSPLGTCYISTALAIKLSRYQEYRADRYAVQMHPENRDGLISFFAQCAHDDLMFADRDGMTHPALNKRIAALQRDDEELVALSEFEIHNGKNTSTSVA